MSCDDKDLAQALLDIERQKRDLGKAFQQSMHESYQLWLDLTHTYKRALALMGSAPSLDVLRLRLCREFLQFKDAPDMMPTLQHQVRACASVDTRDALLRMIVDKLASVWEIDSAITVLAEFEDTLPADLIQHLGALQQPWYVCRTQPVLLLPQESTLDEDCDFVQAACSELLTRHGPFFLKLNAEFVEQHIAIADARGMAWYAIIEWFDSPGPGSGNASSPSGNASSPSGNASSPSGNASSPSGNAPSDMPHEIVVKELNPAQREARRALAVAKAAGYKRVRVAHVLQRIKAKE